jgi:solute:Na+ symporter, SSS family
VGVCFIFGRFVRRVNHAGALATLSVGLVLGLSYVLATLVPGLQPLMPKWLAGLHFYEVLPFFFVLLSTVILSVSLLTAPPASEQLAILDLRTAAGGELGDESLPWWRGFPFWLAVYLGVLAALYVVF